MRTRGHQMLVTNTFRNRELSHTCIQGEARLLRSIFCPVIVKLLVHTKDVGWGEGKSPVGGLCCVQSLKEGVCAHRKQINGIFQTI